jgi:serine phosphatase RsbU (regulator of sigma subunit)
LAQAVTEAANQSAEEILNHIVYSVEAFGEGVPPFDDLTLLVVRYTG